MSLTAHLTASTAEHGRLRFHPDCPYCRAERLAGSLGGDALVSRRAHAALAAGLLAFSAAAPPALAQGGEVEQEQEGMAAPGGEDPGTEPDFDPGGDDTFDVDTAPVPGEPGAGGQEDDEGLGAPVDTEPTTDPDVPRVLEQPEDTPEPPPAAPEPAPAPAPPPPTPVAPEPAAPAPPPATDVKEPAAAPESPKRSTKHRPSKRAAKPRPHAPKHATEANPAPVSAAPTPSAPASARVVDAAPATAVAASQPIVPPASPVTGDSYTVRPGDSLWSVARRILGPQASAGQIAREVNRLWELNQARIGTGNPSLVHVGTVLEL